MNWIDSHVHVWTENTDAYPRRPSYPIPEGVAVKEEKIDPAHFPPEEIISHGTGSGVDRIVLIQMSFYGTDNSYMTDAIRRYPKVFRGVGYVDPDDTDVGYDMATLLEQGVTGFRIVPLPGTASRWLQTEGYDAMFRSAEETRQAIGMLVNPNALKEVDRMARKHPKTKIVLDHMARIGADGQIRKDDLDMLAEVGKNKNVYVKVSAFYALGRKEPPHDELVPLIRRVYDAFGPERMMWASDCPFQTLHETYEDSISLVRDRLDFLSTAAKQQILQGTAEQVYFYQ